MLETFASSDLISPGGGTRPVLSQRRRLTPGGLAVLAAAVMLTALISGLVLLVLQLPSFGSVTGIGCGGG